MWRRLLAILVLLGLVALAACAAEEKATPAPASPTAVGKPDWQQEWDRVAEAAKKEGKLILAGPPGAEVRRAITEPFERQYGITVEYRPMRGAEVIPQIKAERDAGQYLLDIRIGGTTTTFVSLKPMGAVDPLEPVLILPDVKNPKTWRGDVLPFVDKDRQVLAAQMYSTEAFIVNTGVVKPAEFKSYKDLLDPKWKGKITLLDPTIPGSGDAKFTFFYLHPELGPDFIRALAKQDIVLTRSYEQLNEWVATGKYPIGIGPSKFTLQPMIKAGVPIGYVTPKQMREGGSAHVGEAGLTLISKAPHPNAAKLYINWFLSKDAQTAFSQVSLIPSTRLDVPMGGVEDWEIPLPNYINTDIEANVEARTKVRALATEVFAQ